MESAQYPVPDSYKNALITPERYQQMYQRSVDDPVAFWSEQAQQFLHWFQPWQRVLDWDYRKAHIRWFEGGKLNVSYNCLDRHLAERGEQTALIWESDEPARHEL